MLPIQVLIVEDDPMARTLFEIYLKNSEKYKVAGSVESAAMAELYCLTKQIDLILMDVCTALHASGLDAAEKIKKNHPGIKILIVTSQPECDFIERARRAGVDSFWPEASKLSDFQFPGVLEKSIFSASAPRLVSTAPSLYK